jgi:hypothetical protein
MRPALQPRDVGPVAALSRQARPASGGDVAQLGERLVRNEEVVGSIPIISTSPFPVAALPTPIRAQRGPVAWSGSGDPMGPGPARPELVNPVRTGR